MRAEHAANCERLRRTNDVHVQEDARNAVHRRCAAGPRRIRSPPPPAHFVNGRPLKGPYPAGLETAIFGLGCFWGAERKFWELGDGIYTTAVGYAGGLTPNPTYEEVCSGRTGHNEVVLVVYDPKKISYEKLLKTFWENHDPTQGMRQGNDVGTQYRSGIYATTPAQQQGGRGVQGDVRQGAGGEALRRDHDRDRRRAASSTSPRTITSSIWPRTRRAIAGSAAPACPARSARRRAPRTAYISLMRGSAVVHQAEPETDRVIHPCLG